MKTLLWLVLSCSALAFVGCGGDDPENDGPTEADDVGIGAMCDDDDDCPEVEARDGMGGAGGLIQLSCLTQFTDGYCAIEDCLSEEDCPQGSTCVAHDDGENYCFRECENKPECNANRSPDSEANCVGSFDFADSADDRGQKVCEPPSSGT